MYELKQFYILELTQEGVEPINVRMFFGGVELVDSNLIYQHEISDGFTVNVMIRQTFVNT